jgi:hypothetical protein
VIPGAMEIDIFYLKTNVEREKYNAWKEKFLPNFEEIGGELWKIRVKF